jgi:hypothetical protein
MAFSAGGALGGAASGASTGMIFGPWGAAAGGLAGGLLGGFGGSDAPQGPATPDYMKLASAQQNNPLGQQGWSIGPDGKPVSNSQFTGQAGQAFQGLLGGMNSAAGMDPAAAGQAASDKMYGVLKGRLDPQWQQNQGAFQSQMANSGLEPGTEASMNASRQFGQQQNDAYSQASGQAIGLGQQEQAQARQNAMLPFQQANSMMGMLGQQGSANPYGDAALNKYKGDLQNFSIQQKGQEGKKGGGGGGLGGLLGGKGGSKEAAPNYVQGGYNENLGGYNF